MINGGIQYINWKESLVGSVAVLKAWSLGGISTNIYSYGTRNQ